MSDDEILESMHDLMVGNA